MDTELEGVRDITTSMKKMLEQAADPTLLLTPKINEYYMTHGENLYTKEALNTVFAFLGRPGRKRSGSFSASAAGSCLRKQELGYIGSPQKPIMPSLHETFQAGHWYHARWQALLISAGLLETPEVPLKWPKYNSMGSADGKGFIHWEPVNPAWANREYILELKTVGEFAWDKKATDGPPEAHLKQTARYSLVSGISLIVYIIIDKHDKSGIGWKEFVYEVTDEQREESRQELEDLNSALANKELHPMLPTCRLKAGYEWTGCPYGQGTTTCSGAKTWEEAERRAAEDD